MELKSKLDVCNSMKDVSSVLTEDTKLPAASIKRNISGNPAR